MVHMIERSLRAHGHEIQGQLHQYPGASVREKARLGHLPVPVKTVLNALQGHEEVLSENFNSDGIHLNDKTKPCLKSDAKIRRMTESILKMFERPLQAPVPAQDCQKGLGGASADNDPLHMERHTIWNVRREL